MNCERRSSPRAQRRGDRALPSGQRVDWIDSAVHGSILASKRQGVRLPLRARRREQATQFVVSLSNHEQHRENHFAPKFSLS
ncbi:MAG: hypothetical protein EAZ43_12105 [Betaproteobacteria bacterium]|nr:MAG: hypothetical protein EAZ43_12105 [Betaproteobacteria bacterium]